MTGPGLHTSRRAHLRVAGAVAGFGGLSLAACGAPQAAQQTATLSTAPVTIQLYKRGTLTEPDVATMLTDWNAAHPTWKVELVQNKRTGGTRAPHSGAGDAIDVWGGDKAAREMIAIPATPKMLDHLIKRDKYAVNQFSAKEPGLVGTGKAGKLHSLYCAWGGNLTPTFYH